MAWLSIIGISIFMLYTIISIIVFGIPQSLSYTYYLWIKKNPKLKWPFRVTFIVTALLLIAPMLALGEGSMWQFTGFLAPFGLMMIGAAPDYENPSLVDKWWHPVVAFICCIASALWQIFIAERFDFLIYGVVLCVALSILTKTVKKSYIFWLEMMCVLSTFACILKIYFF